MGLSALHKFGIVSSAGAETRPPAPGVATALRDDDASVCADAAKSRRRRSVGPPRSTATSSWKTSS